MQPVLIIYPSCSSSSTAYTNIAISSYPSNPATVTASAATLLVSMATARTPTVVKPLCMWVDWL